MTTEVRNALIIVGSEAAAEDPEVRNVLVVVGSDGPAQSPEARNVIMVVGSNDPAFDPPVGGGGATCKAALSVGLPSLSIDS